MKARRKKRRGEAFTRISLLIKELEPIRSKEPEGETFTHILLYIKGLIPKGEEVKAKNRKTPDARTREGRWRKAPQRGAKRWGGRIKKTASTPKEEMPTPTEKENEGCT